MPVGFLGLLGSLTSGLLNRSMAREQMQFQERMSNTAFRRQMHDMRQAGLNPLLAKNMGGATTPPGARADMPDLGQALVSSMEVKRKRQEIENMRTQQHAIRAAAARDMAQSRLADDQRVLTAANVQQAISQNAINTGTAQRVRTETQLMQAGIPRARADQDFYSSGWGRAIRNIENTVGAMGPAVSAAGAYLGGRLGSRARRKRSSPNISVGRKRRD